MSGARPLVLYIPGLRPKPEPRTHLDALRRCLHAGLDAVDTGVADEFVAQGEAFDLVGWTYDFYQRHQDFAHDRACIDELLGKQAADADDRREANSWRRRVLRWLYHVGDRFPVLIPSLADENIAEHLRDLWRYERNRNGIAEMTRRHLKVPLRAAASEGRPVLLLAHSMGSVIAWDSLWQLSRDEEYDGEISLWMTLGSPLGQRYIQRRLLGSREQGVQRFPTVIRRWVNVAAVGELTALDRELARDFAEMQARGLVESIDDYEVYNWYRDRHALNVHSEYGYLANPDTARHVAAWWREQAR